jgi:hypothetical protein
MNPPICKMVFPMGKIVSAIAKMVLQICKMDPPICKMISPIGKVISAIAEMTSPIY